MPAPRKPRHLHLLEGTLRKDRHGTGTVSLVPIDPQPRSGMHPQMIEAWHEIIEAGREYLAQSDRIAVELAAALMVRCRTGMASAAETAQLVGLLGKLGCTPPGRRGLDLVRSPDKDENPFAKFRKPEQPNDD